MLENKDIREVIPHRYPFLMIDRVLEIDDNKKAVGIKNISANEPYFQGHFPDNPIVPGVLIVEAMAQLGGITVMHGKKNNDMIGLFTGINKCKFKRVVKPGDQLKIEVEILSSKLNLVKAKGIATVDGELAAEAEISFMLVEKN
ncbi:3-hydroxyacyl-[acyl-carrier-protein] dehydratase FabZ [Thermoanaerobacterium thermosaccharolyticum]|jgi:3-hydroxyacyl-[acyl-carrier-protein] dehydratase|uniref:3-hydroxyacyl-[acyl-carrier-protein] dehydratase FabZ n=2 Tax=Thermoanaerobacterium thermosaccharolyticum TaxID=1517 RepID=D9TTS2_THETC|nr:beta-hydroxyacyl-(acyl-carrier-protein) dehydratase FabZ [Thermoanaerobacterium thermosaccharolyticum DSM 571]AST57181.1 3-hydroxyacyl-acp dehydratase [Thermoanaerobacterium thermosaccharolyticum]TCW36529.1 3-hydroxyacyl-[acyl-carrier-protein] dehydratase [Thermohydrogenium kirishiense]MBE0068646.1 3-hydroxyacyl-ACP dehydratase FabZ [Thermoanaerobacterium thermosaccharolyticum]MBE0228624.1 3-hydroxyacyl-ACP dehydratase FabZ [Thermoanaerobacterium thermosaccharolyticum]